MRNDWKTEQVEVVNGGVSSAVDPRLIGNNQAAWAMNMVMRGGNPHTRPAFKYCMDLPAGLYQGAGYFSIQGGMFVASIAGNLYRLRIGEHDFSSEQITLGYKNSGTRKKAWFCQTVETLIIQDGESYPIFYDGNVAKRSDVTGLETYNELYDPDATDEENDANLIPQVPIGRQMAYGNGRLWVAQGGFNLVAGDIRTDNVGSELLFSETQYLTGGGALYFEGGINGLGFIPTTGGGDTGALVVLGKESSSTVRADITNRDQWQFIPGFVSPAFRSIGVCGQESIVAVNQDLFWRDQFGDVRSLRNAASSEAGPGNAPLSREVSRVVDFESDKYLEYSSSILSDNRLLFTGNPFLLGNGGVGYKSITSLDFANISTMQGRTAPAYDGIWTGLDFVQLLCGKFRGKQRDFVVAYHSDGIYRLWEMTDKRSDITEIEGVETESQIVSYVEYGRKSFGDPRIRKRLERFDVYLADVDGPVAIDVYWRADNDEKWQKWDETAATVCAKTSDAATSTPHVWKLLKPQQRPQLKTYTIPTRYNAITGFQQHVGFEFQFKVVITGKCRIYRAMAHAEYIPQTPYNDVVVSTCVEEDLSDNSTPYEIPFVPAPPPPAGVYLYNPTKESSPVNAQDYWHVDVTWRLYGLPASGSTAILLAEYLVQSGSTAQDITVQVSNVPEFTEITKIFSTYNPSNEPGLEYTSLSNGLDNILVNGSDGTTAEEAGPITLETGDYTNFQYVQLDSPLSDNDVTISWRYIYT